MGQMLVPALIGAGVGAVGGAATGQNPFKTALLGAGVGAAGAGAGLFGGASAAGATGATTGIQLAQAPLVEGLATSLTPTVVGGSGAAGITGLGTQALGGAGITGLGSGTLGAGGAAITGLNTIPLDAAVNYGNMSRLAVDTPLSFGEKLSNFGSNVLAYGKENPMSLLGNVNTISNMSGNAEAQNQQRLNQAAQIGQMPSISKGNYNPSSSLMNVSPNSNPTPSKNGLLDMMARIPMTDEEKMRLQQLAQYGNRG
jgi:hypothetical protein